MTYTTRKSGLIKLVLVLVAVALLLSLAGPYAVLAAARQPVPETDYEYADSFLTTYSEVREHLEELITDLRADGVTVEYSEYAVDESDDLYIDNIYLPSTDKKTNLIVLTTGVHGMEGYIGSVMLDVFFEEIYPTLDTTNTGILIVANVNPIRYEVYEKIQREQRRPQP